ncbi:hypothetical protein NDU88_001594 [Pleurodeles waltl]|uniref:Uncharacterized protein n=1 Tax=Pleurodeles waltl TaxID=8319 RepID=A0AAV7VZX1_PLEWA|nr:hypothetical protein NDU88_001594 [Pleurodeles waltl]
MKEAEDSLATLKAETDSLKKQFQELRTTTEMLGAKLENVDGRSRHNSIQLGHIRDEVFRTYDEGFMINDINPTKL